ncbi:MAG: hypothetical protein M0R46_08710 [Candidatus Muirbacterium halophilum]|nr:hypothetical protein [Candidatus Muirbacterium halophilum]MCK9475985.1 hypothetical protein [Candidatus Muirbacterium halophilum]
MKWIDFLFSKERDLRKEGITNLIKADLSKISEQKLIKVKEQLAEIIEQDDTDIKFFAKKLNNNIMEFAYKAGITLTKTNEIEEVYNKNSEELIKLLSSEEKMIRINALYALAKNGCSAKHIISLEKFAESALEDESVLAIEAIEAIKTFITNKKEKEEKRQEKRKAVLKSLRSGKDNKEININAEISKKKTPVKVKRVWQEEKKVKKSKTALFYLITLVLISIYHIYFTFIFKPANFIPLESKLSYYNYSFFKPTIVFKENDNIKIKKMSLTINGWIVNE